MFCICSSPAPPELMPGSMVFTIFAASGSRRTVAFAGAGVGLACPVGDGAHAATVRLESRINAASFFMSTIPCGSPASSKRGAYAATGQAGVASLPTVRRFRFAVMASRARSGEHWRETARRAEALGYDALLMPDHITDQLAPLPALVAAADATKRLRVGSFVFDNDYRNPVMLAKEVATLDLLSDGRLELGIGAGWHTRDCRQLG